MITISYDEETGFESMNKNETQTVMLGGIIYNDRGEKRYKKDEPERLRIIAYLQSVCNEVGAEFPTDLHSNGNNNSKVGRVKEEYQKTMPEFMKTGTYKGRDLIYIGPNNRITTEQNDNPIKRKGIYQIVVVYKSENGKTVFSGKGLDIVDNNFASNLYLHMADDLIMRSIFLNPYLLADGNEAVFDLPTRVISKPYTKDETIIKEYKNLVKEYKRMGYKHENYVSDDGTLVDFWRVMTNGYAQRIIQQGMKLRPVEIHTLSVDSISYRKSVSPKKFAFLYLSDCICTYLNYRIKNEFLDKVWKPEMAEQIDQLVAKNITSQKNGKISQRGCGRLNTDDLKAIASFAKVNLNEEYAKQIRARMRKLNNNPQNMFYYFDDVDSYYETALRSVLEGDFFKSLCAIYDGKHLFKGNVKKYYSGKWFKNLEKYIDDNFTLARFKQALDDARKYRITDNISQGRLLYVFEKLEQNKDKAPDKYSEYSLYDLGISAYSHVGNPDKAEECYDKCFKLYQEGYVEESDWQNTTNRLVTVKNDQLRFKEAEEIAIQALGINLKEYEQRNKKEKNRLLRWIKALFKNEGEQKLIDQLVPVSKQKTVYKTWSSLGQVYAYLGEPEAEQCFLNVLNVLKDEMSADYYITLSYLLHYYIETQNQTKYEEYAKKYFNGKTDLGEQLAYLCEEGTKSREKNPQVAFKYALFVFIKAFYVFYRKDEDHKKILKRLTRIDETVKELIPKNQWDKSLLHGHPWEILYKYVALLQSYDDENKDEIENRRKIKESVRDSKEYIIDRIMDYGDVEFFKQKMLLSPDKVGYAKKYETSVNKLFKTLVKDNYILDNDQISLEEKEKTLNHYFTFMYH